MYMHKFVYEYYSQWKNIMYFIYCISNIYIYICEYDCDIVRKKKRICDFIFITFSENVLQGYFKVI